MLMELKAGYIRACVHPLRRGSQAETLPEPAYVLPRQCSRWRYTADYVSFGGVRPGLMVLMASWFLLGAMQGYLLDLLLGFLEDT